MFNILYVPYVTLCHTDQVTYLQSFWRHIAPGADERISHRVDELSGDTEVADLDLALTIDQNVARLHVAVNDLVILAQVT